MTSKCVAGNRVGLHHSPIRGGSDSRPLANQKLMAAKKFSAGSNPLSWARRRQRDRTRCCGTCAFRQWGIDLQYGDLIIALAARHKLPAVYVDASLLPQGAWSLTVPTSLTSTAARRAGHGRQQLI